MERNEKRRKELCPPILLFLPSATFNFALKKGIMEEKEIRERIK